MTVTSPRFTSGRSRTCPKPIGAACAASSGCTWRSGCTCSPSCAPTCTTPPPARWCTARSARSSPPCSTRPGCPRTGSGSCCAVRRSRSSPPSRLTHTAEQRGQLVMSDEAYIYEAIRTPRGRGKKGSLYATKPVDLVVGLIDELRSRLPGFDPGYVDDLVLGVVTPIGDQGGDIAKAAALVAGLPDTVGGMQGQPVLRLRSGGHQPGRAEGPLRLGPAAAGRRGGVDVAGADDVRRRGAVH